ncbi:MAG TPA: tetratricopeptide repeat protein [Variovorax sp.]|nr:tetratricopeptide repeat protein [Variovorax sp.]
MSLPPDASTTPPSPEAFERARQLFVAGLEMLAGGRIEEAEQSFAASLELLPDRVSTLVNLAAVRVRLGRPAEALEAAERVLRIEPRNADAWFHGAEALAQGGRLEEALKAFGNAATLNKAAMPWYRHGQVLQDLERDDEALQSYEHAIAADPAFAPAWTNKGNILRERSRLAEAAEAFRQAIAHGGANELNDYYLAAVSSGGTQATATAPDAYVEGLFDAYANGFERHVVDVLGYRAHEVLAGEITRLAPGRWFDSVLDLGCGTGLCSERLKTCSGSMIGVDLSSQMLQKAEATGNYATLVHQDIGSFLQATDTRHDLVMAGDVFIYVGDLAAVFAGVQRVTLPGGLFCFSLEVAQQDKGVEFELQPTLRFAHSESYARRMAAEHGFEVVRMLYTPLRRDQRNAIDGLFVFLRKTAA